MPPRPDSARNARERNATTRAPSSSDRPPATTAAAISPCECPTTAAGRTPRERQTSASDTITVHNAGCTTSTRSSDAAPSTPRRTSGSDQSTNGANARAHAAIRDANTGEVSSSSTAIPAHCEPWPGKTNTTPPVPSPAAPSTTRAEGSPAASASRPASRSSTSRPTTTARWSIATRVTASACATSSTEASVARTVAASRAACSPTAARDLPDTTHGHHAPSACPGSAISGASSAGACSSTRWALVPLTPKEDTAARRGRPVSGQAVCSVSSSTPPSSQSAFGVGASMWRLLGRIPWRIACTILITPATPDAAWVCPVLDFSEPSSSGRPSPRSRP